MNKPVHFSKPEKGKPSRSLPRERPDKGVAGKLEQAFTLRQLVRFAVLLALDFTMVMLTLGLALTVVGATLFAEALPTLGFLAGFATISTACFFISGLYGRSWRYVSFSHCLFLGMVIVAGLVVAWLAALSIPSVRSLGIHLVPLALSHWAFLTVALFSMRLARRALRQWRERSRSSRRNPGIRGLSRRAILIGSTQWARLAIELAQAEENSTVEIIGILLPRREESLTKLSGIRILGSQHELNHAVELLSAQGKQPEYVIVCDDGTHLSNRDVTQIIHNCRELGLEVCRVRDPWAQLLQRGTGADGSNLPIEVLLGRNEYDLDHENVIRQVAGQCILVTGAGGTIGSELCWQLARLKPSKLVLLDHSEYNLYTIEMRLREHHPALQIVAEICNICSKQGVRQVFAAHRPAIVFHAAALKHVPLVQANPCAGVATNIIGTRYVADAVCEFSAKAMVQVSTDKAVNPIGMMGATKRVGELYSQALDTCGIDDPDAPRFITVRFGNVLGSSGSILPLFERQLREGKPLTITHPDIERYFMSVREAVQLILQGSASALEDQTQRGSIFVLDMGAPIRIVDLACRMISLYGLEPEVDVPINFVGLRPGEKIYEELFDVCEEQIDSGIPGIFEARSRPIPLPLITLAIERLAKVTELGDHEEAERITQELARFPARADRGDFIALIFGSPNGTMTEAMSA